ncbi:MAG: transporter substrate-binding domain-containing protein [Lachnospiraceae bacterium]|nr:transporter substrate-binding domain-containing protein [Lachnospiraceae bacterium]
MKKKLALIMALLLIPVSIAGCGSSSSTTASTEPDGTADTSTAVEAADTSAEVEAAKAASSYHFLEEDLGVESYAIGFRKGDEELAETVSGAVQALVLDGTYDEIGKKYPDIKDYLCLKADDIDASTLPEKGSGDSSFTFKHGFDLDYPPYSFLQDDGSVGGFDVELCQAVCDYLGWGYESVPFNWDAKDMELNAGSCDCIWSGFTKEGREDDYTWGITYSNNTQGILVPGDSDIKTLADLSGKIVGVQTATSAYDMLQDSQKDLADTFAELKVYETYTIAYNDLKAGAIDAIAIDMTAGSFLITDNNS